MKSLPTKLRSILYPMVTVVLVASLWAMAAAHAQADREDSEFLSPIRTITDPATQVPAPAQNPAPAVVALLR